MRTGWRAPERFAAKARDGVTDVFGVIHRPSNFDPGIKYPVIENIYAGPHGAFVPKGFGPQVNELTELGFIVVQIDGMGTSQRSKIFHDVCWKNVGDAGLPDRVLWIKAAAAKYPQMDISRVGIYGTSRATRARSARCSRMEISTRPRCRIAAATTTAWTRSGGTSCGWAGRSARIMRSSPM